MNEVELETGKKQEEVKKMVEVLDIRKTLKGDWALISQMNSIAQHHFTEVFIGNATDGGVFCATKLREKINEDVLKTAFKGNLLPSLVMLEKEDPNAGERAEGNEEQGKEDEDEDGKEKEGGGEGGEEDEDEEKVEKEKEESSEEEEEESSEEEEEEEEEEKRKSRETSCRRTNFRIRFFHYEDERVPQYKEVFLKQNSLAGNRDVKALVYA